MFGFWQRWFSGIRLTSMCGAREIKGSVTVEFALIAVPLLGLLFAILETVVVSLLGVGVQQTTVKIARLVKTGIIQQYRIQSADDFRSRVLCPAQGPSALPPYLSCDKVIFDIRTADSMLTADMSRDFYKNPAHRKFCLGQGNSVVIVRIAYVFPSILPLLATLGGGGISQVRTGLVNDVPDQPGWNHLILDATAFQNEGGGGDTPACS